MPDNATEARLGGRHDCTGRLTRVSSSMVVFENLLDISEPEMLAMLRRKRYEAFTAKTAFNSLLELALPPLKCAYAFHSFYSHKIIV